jgi:glutaredoxin
MGKGIMVITLYSKAGCHLCDEARTLLENVAADADFELDEIDIRRDAALFDRYRYRIPVIAINGAEALEGRFDEIDLLAAINRGETT